MKKIACWIIDVLSTSIIGALVGYLVIATTLWGINKKWPETYNWLTRWANQKESPMILNCTFNIIKKPDYPELSYLTWYEVTIKTNFKNSIKYVLVYPIENRKDDVYVEGHQANRKKFEPTGNDKPYLILWKTKIDNIGNLETIDVAIDNKILSFTEGQEVEGSECPIKVEFFNNE